MQRESTAWPGAAEFPHDNPAFDRGALWTEAALCFSDPVTEVAIAAEPVAELAPVAEPAPVVEPEPVVELAPVAELEPVAEIDTLPGSEAVAMTEVITEIIVETAAPEATTATTTTTTTTTATTTATATATASLDCDEPDATDPPIDDPVATFVRAVTAVALAYGPAETAAHIESLFHFGTLDSESLSATAQAALCEGRILEATDDGVRTTESFASTRSAWESILRGESGDLSACGESTLDTWTADLVARLVASPDKTQTIRRDLRRRGIAAFGMLS